MVESSDIQSAVARTQQVGRMQQQATEHEELRRKRFELERARELAETAKKIQEAKEGAARRPIEDRWDGSGKPKDHGQDGRDGQEGTPAPGAEPPERGPGAGPGTEGGIDVRV
jgi:hypothetical protein